MLPVEFQELAGQGPDGRVFFNALRARVEDGMSYENFEESVRQRLEPAGAAINDGSSDLTQWRPTSYEDEMESGVALGDPDVEDVKDDEEADGF